ncbi:MAG: OmpA family protein [Planctomycetaceae bacterium]|nr:OmpA family protein [Planctomycetaceae bacterium]
MAKRKKREPAGIPEWMVTFGDMMSLLLCFFIMLFAMSTITPIKWEAFVETQNMKMGYAGTSRIPSQSNKPSAALGSVSERARRQAAMTGGQPTPGRAGDFLNRQTIQPDGTPVKGGLIRFELGSDQLDEQAKQDLAALLPALEKSSNKIKIEGYVSPAEEEDGFFSRGIYLANSRANEVMNYLVELGLRRDHFEIGFSPKGPNRAVLPSGSNPRLSGASAAVYLINGRPRPIQEPEPPG